MALTPEQRLTVICAESGRNRDDLVQQMRVEFYEENTKTLREWNEAYKDLETKEVIMNEKQQIEAVKQMAKKAAGIPTAPSKEFEDMVVKSVLEDIDEHVREELDISAEFYKTLDDDDTERDVIKAVVARVRALVELNSGFKRPDKEPENDEEAVRRHVRGLAGLPVKRSI